MDARAKAASLSIWCRPVEPEPVGGGITNANFLVDDGQRRCFVRVGDDIPVHHILRWHELAASRAAHAAGISPAVLHAEPGRAGAGPDRGPHAGARGVRRAPAAGRGSCRCCAWSTPRWRATCAGRPWRSGCSTSCATTPTLQAGSSRPHARRCRTCSPRPRPRAAPSARSSWCSATTTCCAANFIDDGRRLWLVDWDYGRLEQPPVRPGRPRLEQRAWPRPTATAAGGLFRAARSTIGLRRRAPGHAAASLLREAMWSMVSELHSTAGLRLRRLPAENLERFERAWAEFEAMV